MRWIIGVIIEKILKFAYDEAMAAITRYKARKEAQKKIDQDEAAKAEKLKQAKTEKEIDDAITDSLGDL